MNLDLFANKIAVTPTARRLLGARFGRSVAQGALIVELSLYLDALHWTGREIGGTLGAAGAVSAVLTLLIGVASDRFGRRRFVIGYEVMTCVCAVVAFSTTRSWPLGLAIVFAGFGRGANGSAGPFAPAEQAWLAENVEASRRGFIFSLNTALGFLGMAFGALAAMVTVHGQSTSVGAANYRLAFLIVLAGNAANILLLLGAREECSVSVTGPTTRLAEDTRTENQFLSRLVLLNSLNGLAVGLTGPLTSYWFAKRFHVDSATIAPVMAATFFVTAFASFYGGVLTRRAGTVNVVVWGRGGGLAMMVLLPLMPNYWGAAAIELFRSGLFRGTLGARQSLVVSAFRLHRRGLGTSLNALSSQLPRAVGPVVAGTLIGRGWFSVPFYLGAILQVGYLAFYRRLFGGVEESISQARSEF